MLETNHCYCMDCMEGMAQFQDGCFDLAVVDP
ncbi:site-specific DNA-methyltransferase, partial [Butyricicoccus sp. AM29-23AC]